MAAADNDANLGTITHSGQYTGTPLVFSIDFQQARVIQYVKYLGRTDCCTTWVLNAEIRIGSSSLFSDSLFSVQL